MNIFSAVLCFFFMLCASGCTRGAGDAHMAVNGAADVSSHDFVKDGGVELEGQWEFYPGLLLSPSDFSRKNVMPAPLFISVPSFWKDTIYNNSPLPGKGLGTYRIRLIMNDSRAGNMYLILRRIYSGYRLWINGIPADEKSMPDSPPGTARNYIFIHNKSIIPFTPLPGANEIVLQVANSEYESGGIGIPPQLVEAGIFAHNRFIKHTVEMIIVGLVLVLAISSIIFYFSRSGDASALYFGLFSLSLALNIFNLNIPVLSGPLAHPRNPYVVDYTTVILIIFFVTMTVKALFPGEFSMRFCRIHQVITAIFVPMVMLAGFRLAEKISKIYFIFMMVLIIYCAFVFYKAIRNRREDAVIFLIGFAPLFAAGINDVLYALWIIKTVNVAQYSMVVMSITTSIVISRRYSRAMKSLQDDLVEKNVSLEKLDRIKDQFLASTSHELRTPLHGMIGLIESMLSGSTGTLPPLAKENLLLISSSSHRLANMVNDILDMAKIQDNSLSLNMKPVDLYPLSKMVVRLSLPLADGKPVHIVNSMGADLPMVYADEDRVRQVLHNLVGNAVKFTSEGQVEISARVTAPVDDADTGQMVEVSVADTGIGVPVEFREAIFEPYRQVDGSDTRTYGGTGLGLAIAKQIVELHHGTIGVSPGEHGGSVFTFTLPVSEERQHVTAGEIIIENMYSETGQVHDAVAGSTTPDFTFIGSPVFLAVDDDPLNLRVIKNYLEPMNCTVKTADNGIKALGIIEREGPIDLVFLDIMMPGMSGYEVCRRIRTGHSPEELPVIMVTAKNMMADINAAFDAGANDYIVKPFQSRELLARAANMLKLRNISQWTSRGITISVKSATYSFRFSDIIYIESSSKNVIIHTAAEEIQLPVLMKDIKHRLPPDIFVRIHKSYVVNTQCIRKLEHVQSGRYRVVLAGSDDIILPVGRAFRDLLMKKED